MNVYLGADHRGLELKNSIKSWLVSEGFQSEDCGAFELNPDDDYPIFASKVAEKVSKENGSKGILFCGSGVGVDIVANKFPNIRSGLAIDQEQIKKARQDDDINILAIAADSTDFDKSKQLVKSFLETKFEASENHKRRIEEINQAR